MSHRRSTTLYLHALAGLAAFLGFDVAAAPRPPVAGQQPQHFSTTLRRKVAYEYLLFLPRDYVPRGGNRWPLMVFLHGAGERGTNLQIVATHGPPKLVAERPDFPFVLVSPQCPEGQLWDVEALDAFLTSVLGKLNVDPHRVCLTGLSMGGNGSWTWATAHPERFAAVAPICGWSDPIRIRLASGDRKERLKRLPIWAFHGAKDNAVPLSGSESMIAAYKGLGNNPKFTVYPDAGHDSWTAAYNDPALFDWLLQQRAP